MKSKIYIVGLFAATLAFAGCSLDQEPGGSTITQGQYEKMDNILEGTVKGIYSELYAYGGAHDYFGQRSIDMYGDLLCGDMGMKTQRYGWFVSDERMRTYGRRAYFWSFYYGIIRLCNQGINLVEEQGIPELEFDAKSISEEQYNVGNYYAQLLTLRGWAYAALQRYFCKTVAEVGLSELSVPIYTEEITRTDSILGGPRATADDVYRRVEEDLMTAISYFEAYSDVARGSKLYVNVDVARTTLAYSYLNKMEYTEALKYIKDMLDHTDATVLPNAEVLTNGFNNLDTKSWIWGEDVTVQNTTSLASFFGQCDIYSYSYASAGDVKGIDENLYKEIQNLQWDIREGWWNNYYTAHNLFQYAPDGKFFSAKSTTPRGDRDWLSDNVYMRVELAYLIGAEAAYRGNDNTLALDYLRHITDERVKVGADSTYNAYIDGLKANADNLGEAIRYNWRVELWGEGYGLQTFRRWGKQVTLGSNHLRVNRDLVPTTERIFSFELPTNENRYNPYIRDKKTLTSEN